MADPSNDPKFVAIRAAKAAHQAARRAELKQELDPVCLQLAKAQLPTDLGQLPALGPSGRAAIPILLHFLPLARDRVAAEAIVRALSVPWARPAATAPLIAEFRRRAVEAPLLGWAIGNALDVIADDSVFDDVVDLATDPTFGKARAMVVLSLKNMTRPEAVDVLQRLLNDDVVAGHAVMALGELKATKARAEIEKFMTHPKPWVRTEAKKALKKIDR